MSKRFEQAKKIDMVFWLSKHGYTPVRENSRAAYYLSPFRDENNPSFVVTKADNRWADYGKSTATYDIIDFVAKIEEKTTGEAADILLKEEDIQIHRPEKEAIREEGIEIVSVEESITNQTLIEYLEDTRNIPAEIANEYCQEVLFSFTTSKWKRHYAIGQENDRGGFSLRTSWWKGANRPAGITTVNFQNGLECLIFEGTMDWLSYIAIYGKPDHTVIILNSLVFIPFIIDVLQSYDLVHVWLDADAAADEKIGYMLANNVKMEDHRDVFDGHKDLNEFLVSEL